MLQAYTINSAGQAYTAGTNINFANVKVQSGNTKLANNTTVTLEKTGKYLISFDGELSAASANVSVQMYNNGSAVTDAVATATSDAATDIQDLAFNTIVEVLPSCCAVDNSAKLTFVLPNAATLFKANIVVHRLCQ